VTADRTGHPTLTARRTFTHRELARVPAGSSGEPLVEARTYDAGIDAAPVAPEDGLLVRDTVARMLAMANARLAGRGLRLRIVDGPRPAERQERYFGEAWAAIGQQHPELDDEALRDRVHALCAVPEVAGHPTGGAVDVTLLDAHGAELDMGTAAGEVTDAERAPTDAPGLTEEQLRNRLTLHDAMVAAGFAPFYGEWWHFSYGDREWAAVYGEPAALYGPL
jgi:D-alanyl-D-alanine dipeptidase